VDKVVYRPLTCLKGLGVGCHELIKLTKTGPTDAGSESAHFSVDKVVYRPLTCLSTHLSTQICGI